MPESGYPVYDMTIRPGDRFLLYTDGAIEPENSSGVPFGDCKLDHVVRNIASRSASELVDQILLEIRRWRSLA
jgi:serine phosphatase RsbU (regulator of sigma subunit)